MNELSRHIEQLMLHHDCVAIPQLGAFVTQWIDAARAKDEPLFLPPQRSVRFNTDIRTDDGLLVASFERTYNISQAEAKRKVQTLILRLRQQLLTDGWADFGTLGQFTQDEDGILTFEPCPAGVVTPSFYGLDTLYFPRLDKAQKARAMRQSDQNDSRPRLLSVSSNHGDIDIHIGHRLVRYVGVAAALAVLFFLLPTHIGKTGLHTPSEAGITHQAPAPQAAPAAPVARQTPEPQAVEAVVAVETPETIDATETAASNQDTKTTALSGSAAESHSEVPESRFAVVLASAIPQKRAEQYAAQLTEQGLTGVRVLKHGKMIRVIMDGFLTAQRAHQEISDLRLRSSEFDSAWVLKLDD